MIADRHSYATAGGPYICYAPSPSRSIPEVIHFSDDPRPQLVTFNTKYQRKTRLLAALLAEL